jgi:hypothetical protein
MSMVLAVLDRFEKWSTNTTMKSASSKNYTNTHTYTVFLVYLVNVMGGTLM